jgi:hypothetical protein
MVETTSPESLTSSPRHSARWRVWPTPLQILTSPSGRSSTASSGRPRRWSSTVSGSLLCLSESMAA